MRGQGRLFRPKTRGSESPAWWMDYTVRGVRHRESTRTTSKREALDVLHGRIGDRKAGQLTGSPERVQFADLRALVETRYKLDGRRSLDRVQLALNHVEKYFGEWRALDITAEHLDQYAAKRLAAGMSRATVNYELAQLRRGFRLAIKTGRLATMPAFDLPRLQNARSGFFEEGEIAAVLLELPADARRDLVAFLRASGWRRDEGRLLTWAAVDRDGGTIRLEGARSKSGKPRVFPFGLAPTLKTLLDARWEARDGLYVFHIDGQPVGVQALRCAWKRATTRAGVPGRLVHDLRRSAARDFRRAGVSEGEIMRLCGWETRSMFDRYNVIDEEDLARAVAKRFGERQATASKAPAPASGDSLTSSATT